MPRPSPRLTAPFALALTLLAGLAAADWQTGRELWGMDAGWSRRRSAAAAAAAVAAALAWR